MHFLPRHIRRISVFTIQSITIVITKHQSISALTVTPAFDHRSVRYFHRRFLLLRWIIKSGKNILLPPSPLVYSVKEYIWAYCRTLLFQLQTYHWEGSEVWFTAFTWGFARTSYVREGAYRVNRDEDIGWKRDRDPERWCKWIFGLSDRFRRIDEGYLC